MAYTALPAWPFILFGILEPAALIWGYLIALLHPEKYYLDQIPNAENSSIAKHFITPNALSLTLQLGNVFALLAAIAVICTHTTRSEIARRYLIVVALADIGHVYSAYRALGDDVFWDVTQWNDMAWGNIGISVFLHLNRLLTVAGLFGEIVTNEDITKKKD